MSCRNSFLGTWFIAFRRSHGIHPFVRGFNRGDVHLCPLHHRIEGALGDGGIVVGDGVGQRRLCDLP